MSGGAVMVLDIFTCRSNKYSLYYGRADGTCLVRYDNETGKGGHRHLQGREMAYRFKNVEVLVADFLSDIESVRRS